MFPDTPCVHKGPVAPPSPRREAAPFSLAKDDQENHFAKGPEQVVLISAESMSLYGAKRVPQGPVRQRGRKASSALRGGGAAAVRGWGGLKQ